MGFSLSPSVDVFEKNLAFNITNLPSAKTGMVVKSDWGEAFIIKAIPTDKEMEIQFGTPTNYNYKDWFMGSNFTQYASSLFSVRPIDQAKITKQTAIALSGGEGSSESPVVPAALTTYQGFEQGSIYNQDLAELNIPPLVTDSVSKVIVEYGFSAPTWTYTNRAKIKGLQLTAKATTGADSGILMLNSVDTFQLLDNSGQEIRLIDLDQLGGWTLSGDMELAASDGSNFAAGDVITWGTSGTAVIASIATDVLSLTGIAGEAPGLAEAISGGSVSPGTGTVDGAYTLLSSFTITGSDPYTVTGTVSNIRLAFYHKFVTNTQDIGVAVCSNNGAWVQNVTTDISNKFSSYFEFRPDFSSGEFAVIIFKNNGDATFTDLEKFVCSYNVTGRDTFNKNIYAEEVFLKSSNYLYCKVSSASSDDVNTGGGALPVLHHSSYTTIYPRIGALEADKATFPAANVTANGAYDGAGWVQADIDEAYSLFEDSDTFDVNIVMAHEDSINKAANITAGRKDAISINGPFDHAELVGKTSSEATLYLTNEFGTVDADADPLLTVHDTYSTFYGNMKYQYDKYNDMNRWLPVIGDVAGLYAETDIFNDPWWAPAGLNRGIIRNIIKLAFNPKKANRNALYSNSINPILSIPGEGTGIVLGQKTTTSVSSAFDRVNVRRLMITMEKAIATALRPFMFEFNDSQTRDRVRGDINPYLSEIKARRGIYDYLVVCDSTNNTSAIIDQNGLVCDIFVKPTKVAEYIQINMIVTKSGTEFSELAA